MAKTLEQKREERLAQITKLVAERDAINEKLDKLMGVIDAAAKKVEQTAAPADFSLTDAILAVLAESEKGSLKIPEVVGRIATKYNYRPDRKNVQGTLYYLVTRHKIEKIAGERGAFAIKK